MEKIIFEDLPSTKTPLNAENLNKIQSNAENAILENKINLSGFILWTNSNPAVNFSAQTISLLNKDYDILEFWFLSSCNESNPKTIVNKIKKGDHSKVLYYDLHGSNAIDFQQRIISYLTDTEYKIEDASVQFANSTNAYTDNSKCIPYCVIGYKTGLFE